jgi:phospholipid-binding lipoprotein MlaA
VSVLTIPHAMLLAMAPLSAGELPAAMPAIVPATQVGVSAADPQVVPTTPPADPATTAAAAPAPAQATPPQASEAANPDNPENDIIVTAARRPLAPDPFSKINEAGFAVTDAVDKAFVGPVSLAYKHNVPEQVRSGIHNFLYNLREPVVFVNFLLQLKIGKAVETVGRFTVNSTVGVGGVMDIARRKPFHWPRRGNGFADTLGFYGIPNGPFMFLPIVGPTTVRDLFGGFVDRLILPVGVGSPFNSIKFGAPAGVLGALDHRAEFDEELHILHDNVPSPYESSRDFYLRRRQAEIDYLKGRTTKGAAPMSENPLAYDPLGYIAPPKQAPAPNPTPTVAPPVVTPPPPAAPAPAEPAPNP